jgi:hypothetical protein
VKCRIVVRIVCESSLGKRKEHVFLHLFLLKTDESTHRKRHTLLENQKLSESRWFCKTCGIPLNPGLCDTRYHALKQHWTVCFVSCEHLMELSVIVFLKL